MGEKQKKLGTRRRWLVAPLALVLVATGLALAGCGGDDESSTPAAAGTTETTETTETTAPTESAPAEANIVQTAVDAGQFTTLASLLKTSGLDKTLAEGGPFTVFAPTDDAFAKVPQDTLDTLAANPDQLENVLLYHVADGKVLAEDVVTLNSVETLNGESLPIEVKDGTVMVGDAKVVQTDVEASNGVIHVIDTVLIPS